MLRTTPSFTPPTTTNIANSRQAYSAQPQRQGTTFGDVNDFHHMARVLQSAIQQVEPEKQTLFQNQVAGVLQLILEMPNTERMRLRIANSNIPDLTTIRFVDPHSSRPIRDAALTWTINPQAPWEIGQQLFNLYRRLPEIIQDPRFSSGGQSVKYTAGSLSDLKAKLFAPSK